MGVEDWGFQHPMQALICSDQPPAPLVPPAAVAQCPPGRTEIENGRCVDGVMYRVWDDNDDPLVRWQQCDKGGSMRTWCRHA